MSDNAHGQKKTTFPKLPFPQCCNGTLPKPSICTGCEQWLEHNTSIVCSFSQQGFDVDTKEGKVHISPCGTAYHDKCLRIGSPFCTRHTDGMGLTHSCARGIGIHT
eukprot:2826257-Ditylum_brightwellii.AAC.1